MVQVQSALAPEALMTALQRSRSSRMNCAMSSGLPPAGIMLMSCNFFSTSGFFSTSLTKPAHLREMAKDMPGGPTMPCHTVARYLGKLSDTVGTCG